MDFNKFSGNYEIVDSATLFMFDSESNLKISVKCSETFSFNVVFKFVKTATKESNLRVNVEGSNIVMMCENFDNSLGSGPVKAIELATHEGKKLYIKFYVYALGQGDTKKLDYNIFREC